jgi:hypothetical protein
MVNNPVPVDASEVRELVVTLLARLGRAGARPLGERPLTCDRYCVGVRFAFEGVSAIWLSSAAQLRFVDDSGKLLKIVSLATQQPPSGQAA